MSKTDTKPAPSAEPIFVDPENTSGEIEKKKTFNDPSVKRKHLENESFEQDITDRRNYAKATSRITAGWVVFMGVATLAQMVLSWWDKGLSEASYIALMTSSTATVLGMWGIVGAYLFWRPRSGD